MNITTGGSIFTNKFGSIDEALKNFDENKIKVEMTGTEYLKMLNDHDQKLKKLISQCHNAIRERNEQISLKDNEIRQCQDEVTKLEKRCDGLGNAVAKWKKKAEGTKDSASADIMACVKKMRFRFAKHNNNAFSDITIETNIPKSLRFKEVRDYFSNVDARTIYHAYPEDGNLKIIEVYLTAESNSWYAVLEGTDWTKGNELYNNKQP